MISAPPIDVLGLSSGAFIDAARDAGIRPGRAMDIYRGVFRGGTLDGVPAEHASRFRLVDMPVVRTQPDGVTTKFAQQLPPLDTQPRAIPVVELPALETESVILPQEGAGGRLRHTLCVSSQVGCAMGCDFCETAQMGRMRQLTPPEIVGQWFAARHHFGVPIENIVFMGMGEPLDNQASVFDAIEIFVDRNGPAIPASRVTVSTVGHVPGIAALAACVRDRKLGPINLAVSLNASNDTVRDSIMPINRRSPMAELLKAMRTWTTDSGRRVLVEYVLIPGVNDAPEHADEVVRFLRGLPSTLNVIPYNPRRDSPWPAPSETDVNAFVARVADGGQPVRRRRTLGRSVMAACGQLGNPDVRGRRFVRLGTHGGPSAVSQ